MNVPYRLLVAFAVLVAVMLPATAAPPKKSGPADVVGGTLTRNLNGSFDVRVTVRSRDKGPEYYCDRIEFLDPDGKVLHTFRISKPHVNDQPFSETVTGLRLPEGLEKITVRARMRPDGAFGKERSMRLPPPRKK